MTLFRNTLLVIIAIQVLVLIQVYIIQNWDTKPKLSAEEYQFFVTLSTSAQIKLEKHDNNLIQNKFFTVGQGHIRRAIKNDVESTAKNLLGTPYVWGATGPNKFDCSGFTQKVFRKAGIQIPRNSRAQAKVGKHIAYKHLKRGDMVFFATNRKNPKRVTHVGIYLSKGKFIHASSGGKRVVISSLETSQYYKNNFLWGRRIIRGHKTKQSFQMLSLNKADLRTIKL